MQVPSSLCTFQCYWLNWLYSSRFDIAARRPCSRKSSRGTYARNARQSLKIGVTPRGVYSSTGNCTIPWLRIPCVASGQSRPTEPRFEVCAACHVFYNFIEWIGIKVCRNARVQASASALVRWLGTLREKQSAWLTCNESTAICNAMTLFPSFFLSPRNYETPVGFLSGGKRCRNEISRSSLSRYVQDDALFAAERASVSTHCGAIFQLMIQCSWRLCSRPGPNTRTWGILVASYAQPTTRFVFVESRVGTKGVERAAG